MAMRSCELDMAVLVASKTLILGRSGTQCSSKLHLISSDSYYNGTRFSGLENDIANSFLNPLLQVLRFTPLIRNVALYHVAGSCLHEGCLLCEIGFLFDMLEKAGGNTGKVCRATNLFKTYSSNTNGRIPLLLSKYLLILV